MNFVVALKKVDQAPSILSELTGIVVPEKVISTGPLVGDHYGPIIEKFKILDGFRGLASFARSQNMNSAVIGALESSIRDITSELEGALGTSGLNSSPEWEWAVMATEYGRTVVLHHKTVYASIYWAQNRGWTEIYFDGPKHILDKFDDRFAEIGPEELITIYEV